MDVTFAFTNVSEQRLVSSFKAEISLGSMSQSAYAAIYHPEDNAEKTLNSFSDFYGRLYASTAQTRLVQKASY